MAARSQFLIPGLLLGGVVVAVSVAALMGGDGVPADCDEVRDDGGTVAGVTYLERRSQGAPADTRLPMVIVFHSMGSSPEAYEHFYKNIKTPARVITPRGLTDIGTKWGWVKVASKTKNQDRFAAQLQWSGERIAEFIRQITKCRPTEGKPVVTGSSQGGHMSYLMASQYPDLVRGAVALAGYIPPDLWNLDMAPTFGAHGKNDTGVPYDRTKQFWDALQAQGADLGTETFLTGHNVNKPMARAWREQVNAMLGVMA